MSTSQSLSKKIMTLKKSEIGVKVKKRLSEFETLNHQSEKLWFSELCFCILTANSKSKTACAIQEELGYDGFMQLSEKNISQIILKNKHRFHNTKAKRIIEARTFKNIKGVVQEQLKQKPLFEVRNYIASQVPGIGLKEASHFLRNVGYFDLAILDRHILAILQEHKYITKIPSTLSPKIYHAYEKKFQALAKQLHMSCAELDFYFWYLRAGDVLK